VLTRRRGGRSRPRTPLRDDGGFSLVELVAAMAIFTIVIVISLAALRGMVTTTVRTTQVADARVEADRLYNRLDKIVPYASAVNPAGQAGGDWWVEFRTDVAAGGLAARCWQLRLDDSDAVARLRSWPPGDPASVSAWTTVATGAVVRDGVPPFTMAPADESVARQRLTLALDVALAGAPPYPLDTTFTARNTSGATSTNDGTPVCQEVSRS
jgi:prepilin-type N-terminal cleavage/methylation domain-containing protein